MTDEQTRTRTTDFLPPTGIPPQAFYGWFRQGLPIALDSLYRSELDALRTALTDAIEQNVARHGGGLQHARELAALDPADWERVLEQAAISTPAGMTRSDYARRIAMATAAAFPEAAFRHRMTRGPLREERIGWLGRVFDLNPEVAFLNLDYSPASDDLRAVDFGDLSLDARDRVVADLKAHQRIYAVTGNPISAAELLQAGYHSASEIALAGESDFAAQTGLPAAEARRYQEAAREVARAAGNSVVSCPVCAAALTIRATDAACPNGHGFDRARSGYLNLLLSNKKQSSEPGDSPAMLQSRRAFLQGGYYDAMASAATTAVAEILVGRVDAQVADLGCGEGFFTARLKNALAATMSPAPTCFGVDISRQGIKMATSYDRAITWIVGSLHRSPFRPQSLDVVLSMFAPIDAADVRRVLRDDGALVTVTPGPDHLDMLRLIIYSSVKPHPQTPALMAGDTLFEPTGSERVRYPIVLDTPAQIMNLLAMTPYYWHISRATKAHFETLTRLELTVDAYVSVFRPVSR